MFKVFSWLSSSAKSKNSSLKKLHVREGFRREGLAVRLTLGHLYVVDRAN